MMRLRRLTADCAVPLAHVTLLRYSKLRRVLEEQHEHGDESLAKHQASPLLALGMVPPRKRLARARFVHAL